MIHRSARKHNALSTAHIEQQITSKVLDGLTVYCVAAAVVVLMFPGFVIAQEEIVRDKVGEQVRIYKTREERREAGLKHEITDWLTVSGLVEVEYFSQRFSLFDTSSHTHDDDFSPTLQLSLEITPRSWVKGEFIYEYDYESNRHTLDEAIVAFEIGDFELELGKLYVPFGMYFSHFVSGPLLEFGETRGRGMTLSYGPDDRLDLSAFIYKGRAKRAGSNGGTWDWGLAAEVSPFEFGSFGVSYLSDLADSQEGFLSDRNDRYQTPVAGFSAYAIVGYDRFEVTAEFVQALSPFKELAPDRDKPLAWNVELAFSPEGNYEWALRLEGSNELEDAPRLQGGASVAWRVTKTAIFTLEYLQGTFKRGLAEDSKERELDKVRQIGGQISIEF